MKLFTFLLCLTVYSIQAQELYTFPAGKPQTGWSSFENPKGLKGKGGAENKGAKGHASEMLRPGETKVLLDVQGAGSIQRIWMTVSDRSPQMLRSLVLHMYWDGEKKPAVSVPLGDFFGIGLGRTASFQSALFANPEGRSFNCYIPMPFRKGARIVIVNESDKSENLFYDINFVRVPNHAPEVLYFHGYWNRNTGTELGEDFELLPKVSGKGRFLGCNLGIITDTAYGQSWWGEGEVKIYLDGDGQLPTLVGSGTEDYVGTGWGQGAYTHWYQGSPVADAEKRQWAFYRYHIPDPVYFYTDCRVTIQQMGGDQGENVKKLALSGARLIPVTVAIESGYIKLLEMNPVPKLTDANFPSGWTNFYRKDNLSATAYFYLNKPVSSLPSLASLKERVEGLAEK